MNRRQAIQQLTIMGAGLALYPGCTAEEVPVYARVPMDARQYTLFRQFAEGILPVDHSIYQTPESRSEFILTILNDCTPTKDIERYLNGLKTFQQYIGTQGIKSLENLSNEKLDELYAHLAGSKDRDENLYSFYQTTKSLARQHFTSCEKFMTEEMKFEFVPGRYLGCKEI